MKLVDTQAYQFMTVVRAPLDMEGAVSALLWAESERGQLEDLECRLDRIDQILSRFIASRISTVEELNALAGRERFKEEE